VSGNRCESDYILDAGSEYSRIGVWLNISYSSIHFAEL